MEFERSATQEKGVITGFSAQDNGLYCVSHDGKEVARDLTYEEASVLVGDISYYGRPMKCIFSKGMEADCSHPFLHCNICPRRDKK